MHSHLIHYCWHTLIWFTVVQIIQFCFTFIHTFRSDSLSCIRIGFTVVHTFKCDSLSFIHSDLIHSLSRIRFCFTLIHSLSRIQMCFTHSHIQKTQWVVTLFHSQVMMPKYPSNGPAGEVRDPRVHVRCWEPPAQPPSTLMTCCSHAHSPSHPRHFWSTRYRRRPAWRAWRL